ncbi:transposase family protein [Lentzea sp. NPDC051213]|uniref:transposase family protein n=1 Tax=Lentzea sp. NPDC051213 TaxID=3364126 RepID=UPI00378B37F0
MPARRRLAAHGCDARLIWLRSRNEIGAHTAQAALRAAERDADLTGQAIMYRALGTFRAYADVLAHLRNGDIYQRLASGFGVGLATAYRYIRETTALLAARAPSLDRAVTRLAGSFSNFALLDGTVIRIDRCGDRDRLKACYSVKVRHHGITLQVLTDPYGRRCHRVAALTRAECLVLTQSAIDRCCLSMRPE